MTSEYKSKKYKSKYLDLKRTINNSMTMIKDSEYNTKSNEIFMKFRNSEARLQV